MYVCVCEGERKKESGRKKERERVCVYDCVCVCVCVNLCECAFVLCKSRMSYYMEKSHFCLHRVAKTHRMPRVAVAHVAVACIVLQASP